jgi:hypothetical protein
MNSLYLKRFTATNVTIIRITVQSWSQTMITRTFHWQNQHWQNAEVTPPIRQFQTLSSDDGLRIRVRLNPPTLSLPVEFLIAQSSPVQSFMHEIKYNQMRVISLEKIILNSDVPTEDYSLSIVLTNYYKSKTIFLLSKFLCFCAYDIVKWPWIGGWTLGVYLHWIHWPCHFS